MPIIYVPDNTPSRNYGRNSRTEGFAHPAHGTIGGLAKSDTDPRNRGRQRSRAEIEDASRARYDAKRERLAKLREEVTKQQESEKEAKASKRLRVTADKSAAALAASPEAARREVARQQTAEAAAAKRGKPVVRLTAEQQQAGRAADQEANRRALALTARPADALSLMSDRMKPEGPSLSDTLAASEAAGRPHVARAVSNLFAAPSAGATTVEETQPDPDVETQPERTKPSGPISTFRDSPQFAENVTRAIARGMIPDDPEYRGMIIDGVSPEGGGWRRTIDLPNRNMEDLRDLADPFRFISRKSEIFNRRAKESDERKMADAGRAVQDSVLMRQMTNPSSNQLISNAFTGPAGETAVPSAVYSPEQQRHGLFAQQHMLAQANPAVASLPNRIAEQIVETATGLPTKGFSYFNADPGDERGSSIGDMMDSAAEIPGAVSRAYDATEKYLDENGMLIDPRKNAGPRPVRFGEVPQMGAAPRNPLEDFVRRLEGMSFPAPRRNAGGNRSFVR